LAGVTKQDATSIVPFDWHISIIKTMFTNNATSYNVAEKTMTHVTSSVLKFNRQILSRRSCERLLGGQVAQLYP
jgi:hypothetical protein